MDFYERKLKALSHIKMLVEKGSFTKPEIASSVQDLCGFSVKTSIEYMVQKEEAGFWTMDKLGIMKVSNREIEKKVDKEIEAIKDSKPIEDGD